MLRWPWSGRQQAALLASACAVLLALLLWPSSPGQPAPAAGGPASAHSAAAAAARPNSRADSPFAPLPAGAMAPAAAPADPADPLLLQAGLRDSLEALLLAAGETATPQLLKQRLAALVGQHFPAAQAAQALELAQRYVDYRVALGALSAPASLADPQALALALQARRAVRLRHFLPEEYAALFQDSDALDHIALARLEAQRNPQLSAAERQHALQQAEAALPAAQRQQRAEAVQHLAVAAQTASFNAQGLDERARFAARTADYGHAAAQALAQLDHSESDWQARLDQYAQAQAVQSGAAALTTLRQQLFSPQEQLRLEAALALRRQALH